MPTQLTAFCFHLSISIIKLSWISHYLLTSIHSNMFSIEFHSNLAIKTHKLKKCGQTRVFHFMLTSDKSNQNDNKSGVMWLTSGMKNKIYKQNG